MRAHIHGDRTHHTEKHAGGETHDRRRGEGAHDVVEQASHASGEDRLLALFGVISLDHAHAAQRFREPARDLGIDLAALAENRPDGREGLVQRHSQNTATNRPR